MATGDIGINTGKGIDGNSYTSSISNDKLTTNDFLKLMIEEIKLQDPTSPMDSKQMLNSQMQMSSMNTNMEMIKSMQAVQSAFAQSSLSNAANMIGKNIENGEVNDRNISKAFTVRSIENVNGKTVVNGQEIDFIHADVVDAKGAVVRYDKAGNIYNNEGAKTGEKIVISKTTYQPKLIEGKVAVYNGSGEEVASNYQISGKMIPVYKEGTVQIPFDKIRRIF